MSDDNREFKLTFLPYYTAGFLNDLDLSIDIKGRSDTLETKSFETIPLRGSENILDIHQSMISRVYPAKGANDAETNYFPYVEFVDPDFPWRYSKKENSPDQYENNTVDPWLCLIILKNEEIIDITNSGPEGREILIVNQNSLPNLEKAWQTASVQLNRYLGGDINDFLENNPSSHCSRLFCFRLLEPEAFYHGFLVPVFNKALIPYNLLVEGVNGDEKIWDVMSEDPVSLPIYYRWSFYTAKKGDFEDLVRRLEPRAVDPAKVGTKAVDSSEYDNKGNYQKHYFKREGALASLGFNSEGRDTYSEAISNYPKIDDILNVLNNTIKFKPEEISDKQGEPDPLVSYPVYGRYYNPIEEIKEPSSKGEWDSNIPWIHELNLDLRSRLAAAFGTSVLQNNQDDYMEECWSQVGDLNKANEQLRATKAGLGISKSIFKKHLDPEAGKLSPDHFTMLSAPFHSRFTMSTDSGNISIKQNLKNSGISAGVFSPEFKKVASKKYKAKILNNRAKITAPWKDAIKNEQELLKLTQTSKRIEGKITTKAGKGIKDLIILAFSLGGFQAQPSDDELGPSSITPSNIILDKRDKIIKSGLVGGTASSGLSSKASSAATGPSKGLGVAKATTDITKLTTDKTSKQLVKKKTTSARISLDPSKSQSNNKSTSKDKKLKTSSPSGPKDKLKKKTFRR